MLAEILEHAGWIVFVLVLANQAGLPVFAAPALLGVGALAASGGTNVVIAATVAVGAALCADLLWYSLGWWRGIWTLAALRRVSHGMSVVLNDAQRLFVAYDRAFQFGARFLPLLNPVAATFAGAARINLRRFVVGATMSAAVWACTWTGVGYAIGGAVRNGGVPGLGLLIAIMAALAVASLTAVIGPAPRAITAIWLRRRSHSAPRWRPWSDAIGAAGVCKSPRGPSPAATEARPTIVREV
jgi:membrane protein DedA with SNARE-associated domain